MRVLESSQNNSYLGGFNVDETIQAIDELCQRSTGSYSEMQARAIRICDRLRDFMLEKKLTRIEDIRIDWMHGVAPMIRYEYEDERSLGMNGPRVVFPQLQADGERPYRIPTEAGLKKFLAYIDSRMLLAWLNEPGDLLA